MESIRTDSSHGDSYEDVYGTWENEGGAPESHELPGHDEGETHFPTVEVLRWVRVEHSYTYLWPSRVERYRYK